VGGDREKKSEYIAFGILLSTIQAFAQAPAALRGIVTDEDGRPLPAAVVRCQRIPRLTRVGNHFEVARGEAVVSRSVSPDVQGAFAALDLPPGYYVICAGFPGAAYLDPCQWSTSPNVTLSAGAVGTPSLVLRKGVFLRVRVNDPARLLPSEAGIMSAGNLIVGVRFGNGAFHGAHRRIDKTGRDYEMVIPAGMPMSLWVFSRHVTLTDAKGSSLDATAGALIPFRAAAGQDQTFTFNVSGRVPGAN
jgi:hypothetical protein